MASRKICIRNRGFTLLEVLIVLGLVGLLGGLTLLWSLSMYRSALSRDNRATLITLLQDARARAMHGVCSGTHCAGALAHGVHVSASQFVEFEGSTFSAADAANEYTDTTGSVEIAGPSDIVFEPYSGDATSTTLTLINSNGSTSTIVVGALGDISWSN